MSHLDEGTLHALLDGELSGADARQIEAHLGRCTACGTRLDEVKTLRAEADRLIGSLGPSETPEAAAAPVAPATPTASAAVAMPTAPAETWDGPVLLIPEPLDSELRQQRRNRLLGWAAAVTVAAGIGYAAFQSHSSASIAPVATAAPAPAAPARRTADSAVLSPEESTVRPATGAAAADSAIPTDQPPPAQTALATRQKASDAEPEQPRGKPATKGRAPASDPAAEAAAELDRLHHARQSDQAPTGRDVQHMRAAAATADLDRARREEAQRQAELQAQQEAAQQAAAAAAAARPTAPTPAPAPTPASLEDRAQLYLRIDLNEAKHQLGTPMHGIEGMSPTLIGLIQGRLSPGMDTTRPVVRAVYLDAANRLIFLDQQRLRAGQSAGPATRLRNVFDDVVVQLRGESSVSATFLQNLSGRVQ